MDSLELALGAKPLDRAYQWPIWPPICPRYRCSSINPTSSAAANFERLICAQQINLKRGPAEGERIVSARTEGKTVHSLMEQL